jgi:hypothetical protein
VSPLQATSKVSPFLYNEDYPVKFHRSSVFVIPKGTNTRIEKRSLLGDVIWSFSLESTVKTFFCHFDSLFILDKKGTLIVLDRKEGYQKWAISDQKIDIIYIQFPYLVYYSKTGYIGSLSFNSGQLLWKNKISRPLDMKFIGHSGQFALLRKQHLDILELAEGSVSHHIKLPGHTVSIKAAWNTAVLVQSKTAYYHIDTDTATVNSIHLKDAHSHWVQERYQLSYFPTKNKVSLIDSINKKTIWSEPVSPSLTLIKISKRDALLQYTPTHNEILSWITLNRKRTPVTLPEGTLHYFYRSSNAFSYIINNTIVYKMIDTKTTNNEN